MNYAKNLAAIFFMLLAGPLLAASPEELIRPIQDQWAEIKYRQPALR